MKKNYLYLALLSSIALSACGTHSIHDDIEYQHYWSIDQVASVSSLRQIDVNDKTLYEMNYVGSYNLDEILHNRPHTIAESLENIKHGVVPFSEIGHTAEAINPISGTAFAIHKDNNYLLGRNYDSTINDNINLVLHTSAPNSYASIGMVDMSAFNMSYSYLREHHEEGECFLYAPFFTMDGMNSNGLCIAMLDISGVTLEQDKKIGSPLYNVPAYLAVRMVLDKAGSVNEALNVLRSVNFFSGINNISYHFLITDSTGDTVVAEFVNSELTSSSANVLTCFQGSIVSEKGLFAGTGTLRYMTVTNELAENDSLNKQGCMDLLEKVRFFKNDVEQIENLKAKGLDPDDSNNWEEQTKWSSVYDMNRHTLYLCYKQKYSRAYSFNLKFGAI